jgi:hypothetical protein
VHAPEYRDGNVVASVAAVAVQGVQQGLIRQQVPQESQGDPVRAIGKLWPGEEGIHAQQTHEDERFPRTIRRAAFCIATHPRTKGEVG